MYWLLVVKRRKKRKGRVRWEGEREERKGGVRWEGERGEGGRSKVGRRERGEEGKSKEGEREEREGKEGRREFRSWSLREKKEQCLPLVVQVPCLIPYMVCLVLQTREVGVQGDHYPELAGGGSDERGQGGCD